MGHVRIMFAESILPRILGLPPDSTITFMVAAEGKHLIVMAQGPNIPDFDMTKDTFEAPQFELRRLPIGYELWACWSGKPDEAWRVFPSDEMVQEMEARLYAAEYGAHDESKD
jgi:hypothetical protein